MDADCPDVWIYRGDDAAQEGQIESAQGETLLLDEIGEMPLHLQPNLLRVLQERELRRLGENRNVRMDIRVVATANRSLAALVREGLFRADLYYRLNVIALTLPPLRERREDIPLLAQHFLQHYARPGRVTPGAGISRAALRTHLAGQRAGT